MDEFMIQRQQWPGSEQVFCHQLYEFEKGLRDLALHTATTEEALYLAARLERRGVAYDLQPLGTGRTNLFFGSKTCVEVVRAIGKASLADYTPEEDFILGIMLGYGRAQQCERLLKRIGAHGQPLAPERLAV